MVDDRSNRFAFPRRAIATSLPFFLRKFFPEEIYKHLYFQGTFPLNYKGKRLGTLLHSGSVIENQIYWRGLEGYSERLSIQLWMILIRMLSPAAILDIGANTGIYGILAKLTEPSIPVHFFEPAVESTSIIKQALKVNMIEDNFYIHNVFLSNANNNTFGFASKAHSGGVPYISMEEISQDKREIEVRRLDSFKSFFKDQQLRLIKIDIEGGEPLALQGFGPLLTQETCFIIEVLSDEVAKELMTFFSAKTHAFYNIDDNNCTLTKQDSLSKSLKYNFLIIPNRYLSIVNEFLLTYIA